MVFLLLIIATVPVLHAQSERTLLRDGNKSYKDNKFADAEINYRKALDKNKEMKEAPFNLGDALYKQQRYDEAAEQYQIAATQIPDPKTRASALHNLGNSLLKAKKYEESLGAYKEALKLNSRDEDTKYNYEFAKQMLKQQQQQQKQQNKDNKNDKNKDDKNKDDKKKQDQQKKDQEKKDQEQKDQQQKQDQQKPDQQKDEQQQGQPKKQQISKADAERILEALKNQEKDVQKKLHKKVPVRVKVEKDW